MPIIYWFRNDLRLHDNNGFAQAVADSFNVLPVFIIDPRSFDEDPELGFRKAGVFASAFRSRPSPTCANGCNSGAATC